MKEKGRKETYLHKQFPILLNRLMRVLRLLLLLGLDGDIQINLNLLTLKPIIKRICRAGLRLAVLRRRDEDLCLDAHAEAGIEEIRRQRRGLLHVLVRHGVGVVEEQQHGHLVRRHLKRVGHLGAGDVVGAHLALAQLPEPGQLAAAVLVEVEFLEALVSADDVLRRDEGGVGRAEGPEAGAEDVELRVDGFLEVVFVQHLGLPVFVVGVEVFGDLDVLEHALQLVGVFEATGFFQFRYHARLGVIGCRAGVDEAFRQHLGIEFLEHVLVLDVFEDRHDLCEHVLQIGFLCAFRTLLEESVRVFGE